MPRGYKIANKSLSLHHLPYAAHSPLSWGGNGLKETITVGHFHLSIWIETSTVEKAYQFWCRYAYVTEVGRENSWQGTVTIFSLLINDLHRHLHIGECKNIQTNYSPLPFHTSVQLRHKWHKLLAYTLKSHHVWLILKNGFENTITNRQDKNNDWKSLGPDLFGLNAHLEFR